jgi:hypothetical protein
MAALTTSRSTPRRAARRARAARTGVLDRRGFGLARPVSTRTPEIRLDLAVRVRQWRTAPAASRKGGKHMHNQHAGLSQPLAAQRITERQEQAARARLVHGARRPRRRRRWLARRWWQLARQPRVAAEPAVGHPHRVS